MCFSRPVPFDGYVTTNASLPPAGENCNSSTDRSVSEASGVNVLPVLLGGAACPSADTENPAHRTSENAACRKAFTRMTNCSCLRSTCLATTQCTRNCSGRGLSRAPFLRHNFPSPLPLWSMCLCGQSSFFSFPLFCFPPTLRYNHRSFPSKNAANDRNPPPQHSLQPDRALRPAKARRSLHVHLRPHRLRLRPHRQLPHLHLPGHPPPLSETPRLPPQPRHESHRRRRPHHRQRRRQKRQHPRLHRKIRPSLLRRLQNPQH